MGMETNPEGYGGEGMAFQPVEVDPEGLSDPLPHLHPRPGRGGQLDHVKNLWGGGDPYALCETSLPKGEGSAL